MSPVAVVLAAGKGTRMGSDLPKVLHPLANWPMLRHVLANVMALKPARVVGVVAPGARDVVAAFVPHATVVQKKPLGTGDAARAALGALRGHTGPVLVVFGDAADDGQPEAAARGAALLSGGKALKGSEDALALRRGNTGAVIIDGDINAERRAAARNRHFDA